jgi:hypothetical protein
MARAAARLSPVDPAKLAAWRARRQFLSSLAPGGHVEQVATDLVGIQAQVMSSAALSIAIRVTDGRVDDVPAAVADRRLVRSWGMRGTLHLWAADDYPLVVAALGLRENWRRPVWLRYFGVTEAEMEALIGAVGEILGDGRPRSRSELAAEIADRLGPKQGANLAGSWGTYLKPAAMRGLLCQAAGDGNKVTFTRPDIWIGRWRDVDPQEALTTLVRRYLRAYGPASAKELSRWWGDNLGALKPALAALADDLVDIEAGDARGLFLRSELDAVGDERPDHAPVLLGAFDPLSVGMGRRDWFLPSEHTTRVSRTAGWISPVVLLDGAVAGVWSGARSGDRYAITIDLFEPPAGELKRQLQAAGERIADANGAQLDLGFGPVFPAQAPPAEDAGGEA